MQSFHDLLEAWKQFSGGKNPDFGVSFLVAPNRKSLPNVRRNLACTYVRTFLDSEKRRNIRTKVRE
jgi:hypothetical protein